MKNTKPRSPWRSLGTLAAVLIIFIVYAYGFQVTRVDLEEPRKERRQTQLVNIIRGLAQPRLVEYEEERLTISAPVMIPCNPAVALPQVDTSGRYIQVDPNCAEPGAQVTVTGANFTPGETVFLFFVPPATGAVEEIELKLATEAIQVDAAGQFTYQAALRKDRLADVPQEIRAVVRVRSGVPLPSQTVKDTFNKIIETVFLALIATTLGTALAIPISFLAARNLMSDIVSPFGSIMTSVLMLPAGWLLGSRLFEWLATVTGFAGDRVWLTALLLAIAAGATWLSGRLLSRPFEGRYAAARQGGALLGAGLFAVLALGLLSALGIRAGTMLQANLGVFGFLGNFLFVIADLILVVLPLAGALIGAFVLSSLAGAGARRLLACAKPWQGKIFTAVVATLAGAVLVALVFAGIAWLYEVKQVGSFVGIPAAIGAAVMLALSLVFNVQHPIPTGMIIYNITRTILNTLRSIEPLIMVVAFAVWVGIGPFAGVIALALHTIASLGKLYSEQVENILAGPIEAVTATGANRLQTIVYAVIPQIVPPYLAFTIYRWDINVRMSTIIGFGGGGGIGFLVQQNLNLLKYRDASVQMIAIAIVVSTLDFVSAKVRERII